MKETTGIFVTYEPHITVKYQFNLFGQEIHVNLLYIIILEFNHGNVCQDLS